MCSIGQHEWDDLTPVTTVKSFFERPKDVTDGSHRFGSCKGRSICLLETALSPLRVIALELVILFSVVISVLLTAWRLVDAIFHPSRWIDFTYTLLQLVEFAVTAAILPLKVVELVGRYALGAVIHPGIALRRIKA